MTWELTINIILAEVFMNS